MCLRWWYISAWTTHCKSGLQPGDEHDVLDYPDFYDFYVNRDNNYNLTNFFVELSFVLC